MLTTLKNRIRSDMNFGTALEAAASKLNADDEDIRSAFLDDKDGVALGAENDPEIEKLVNDLPVDDDEEFSNEDIKDLVENYIPEDIL